MSKFVVRVAAVLALWISAECQAGERCFVAFTYDQTGPRQVHVGHRTADRTTVEGSFPGGPEVVPGGRPGPSPEPLDSPCFYVDVAPASLREVKNQIETSRAAIASRERDAASRAHLESQIVAMVARQILGEWPSEEQLAVGSWDATARPRAGSSRVAPPRLGLVAIGSPDPRTASETGDLLAGDARAQRQEQLRLLAEQRAGRIDDRREHELARRAGQERFERMSDGRKAERRREVEKAQGRGDRMRGDVQGRLREQQAGTRSRVETGLQKGHQTAEREWATADAKFQERMSRGERAAVLLFAAFSGVNPGFAAAAAAFTGAPPELAASLAARNWSEGSEPQSGAVVQPPSGEPSASRPTANGPPSAEGDAASDGPSSAASRTGPRLLDPQAGTIAEQIGLSLVVPPLRPPTMPVGGTPLAGPGALVAGLARQPSQRPGDPRLVPPAPLAPPQPTIRYLVVHAPVNQEMLRADDPASKNDLNALVTIAAIQKLHPEVTREEAKEALESTFRRYNGKYIHSDQYTRESIESRLRSSDDPSLRWHIGANFAEKIGKAIANNREHQAAMRDADRWAEQVFLDHGSMILNGVSGAVIGAPNTLLAVPNLVLRPFGVEPLRIEALDRWSESVRVPYRTDLGRRKSGAGEFANSLFVGGVGGKATRLLGGLGRAGAVVRVGATSSAGAQTILDFERDLRIVRTGQVTDSGKTRPATTEEMWAAKFGLVLGPMSMKAFIGPRPTATLGRPTVPGPYAPAPGASPAAVFENKFPDHPIAPPRQVFSPEQLKSRAGRRLNYVVMSDGELVVGRIDNAAPGGGHIDLAAGKPVRAAGEVIIRDGQIKSIDNSSGHYLPKGPAARQSAEDAFQRAGFDARGKYIEMFWDTVKGWVPVNGP